MSSPTTVTTKVYSTNDIAHQNKAIITKFHAEIHEGKAFYATAQYTLGANVRQYVAIKAGSGTPHFFYSITNTSLSELYIFEGTGSATTGSTVTRLTSYCFNRSKATGSLNIFTVTTGSSGTGSLIFRTIVGTGGPQKLGGGDERTVEFILNPDITYLMCVSSSAANNNVGFEAYWYEE